MCAHDQQLLLDCMHARIQWLIFLCLPFGWMCMSSLLSAGLFILSQRVFFRKVCHRCGCMLSWAACMLLVASNLCFSCGTYAFVKSAAVSLVGCRFSLLFRCFLLICGGRLQVAFRFVAAYYKYEPSYMSSFHSRALFCR